MDATERGLACSFRASNVARTMLYGLDEPIDLPTTPMLLAAAGGLATEVISLRLLYADQKGDLNIRGAFWHVIQTFVGSVLIIVTALVIEFTGFLLIDPLLGMAFGVVLIYAAWGILRDSAGILMEGAPADIDVGKVLRRLGELDGVADVHHVHAWTLTSNQHVFSAHLRLTDDADHTVLLRTAHDLLRDEFGFHFSTYSWLSIDFPGRYSCTISGPGFSRTPVGSFVA